MTNIWEDLTKNNSYISILAPMEDVTDTVFRQVVSRCYKPDLMFTEFTNCEGICSKGSENVIQRLRYTKVEQPMIAQIWGINTDNYFTTAKLCLELGFAGVDINMGCPERNVTKIGACSALIKNHDQAQKVIEAVVRGVSGKIPVSIKTRIGYSQIVTEEWISFLLTQNIQVITVHARTVKEQSLVPNHFEEIAIACKLRDKINPKIKIIANGDITDAKYGEEKCKELGCDGYMIGRGIFHNPWCFDKNLNIKNIKVQERLELLLYHIDLWSITWGNTKHYPKLKKYFKIYCQGFDNSTELRSKLMDTKTFEEVVPIIKEFLVNY